MEIPLKDIKEGDLVYWTSDSSFCDSSEEKVTAITYEFDRHTGVKYKIIWIEDHKFDSRDGSPLNEPIAYYITPTYNPIRVNNRTVEVIRK